MEDPTATKLGAVGAILWIIPGVLMAIGYVVSDALLCVTVIGIPFGVQSIKTPQPVSTTATEGSVEQSIHDLVQQERVHFVACSEKIICYSHQVFYDGCHLLETEADRTAALICQGSGARPQMLDVLGSKGANAAGRLDKS